MRITVESYEDPARVLDDAWDHLSADATPANLVLSILKARAANPEPGRYWVARAGGLRRAFPPTRTGSGLVGPLPVTSSG